LGLKNQESPCSFEQPQHYYKNQSILSSTESFSLISIFPFAVVNVAMATRGVFQCKKLTIFYCEHGGSSHAVRDYLQSKQLLQWAKDRPSVEIQVRVRNGKHPYIKAEYLSAPISGKRPDLGSIIHQICIKNKQHNYSLQAIEDTLTKLFNKSGRKMTKFTKPIYTQSPSVQGVWTPSLDLHLQPNFEMKFVGGDDHKR
jgi:large subunit ribosomal protein L43